MPKERRGRNRRPTPLTNDRGIFDPRRRGSSTAVLCLHRLRLVWYAPAERRRRTWGRVTSGHRRIPDRGLLTLLPAFVAGDGLRTNNVRTLPEYGRLASSHDGDHRYLRLGYDSLARATVNSLSSRDAYYYKRY